ncbi:MAG: hypothetical protein ACP5TF_01235 [Candidatus Acidifodinimicrobium sp.]
MSDTELEKILSNYKSKKPRRLDFIELIHDYRPVIGNTHIRGGDILLDLNGADEADIKFVFDLDIKANDVAFVSQDIKNDISDYLRGIEIPVEYEKDKLLSYILRKSQEVSGGLKGLDRVRSIGKKAYDIITSNVLREGAESERDGFIYDLEYFFGRGAEDCFKIATMMTLVLSMDEELKGEGVKFRLGLRDLYIYDRINENINEDTEGYNPHAWVDVYLKDKSRYILDEINGIFVDVASARRGVASPESPNKVFVYHFNPRQGVALRRLRKSTKTH